jgi:hypothetical protein
MPGFFDKLKSGADKAAFEADRLRRQTQAQSALKALQRDLENQVQALGQQALALYDAGTLTQPELLALGPQIDNLRQQISTQEAEIERIRHEKPPEAMGPAEEPPAAAPVPERPPTPVQAQARSEAEPPPAAPVQAAAPGLRGHICPKCQIPLPADVRFCPECGSRAVDI